MGGYVLTMSVVNIKGWGVYRISTIDYRFKPKLMDAFNDQYEAFCYAKVLNYDNQELNVEYIVHSMSWITRDINLN